MSTDLFTEHFKDSYFLQSVIDSIDDGVVVQDKQGQVVGFNEKALHILETNEELLMNGMTLNKLWSVTYQDEDPISPDQHPLALTLKTGEPQSNVLMKVSVEENTPKWITVNTRLLQIGDDHFAFATFSDVTNMINTRNSLSKEKKERKLSEKKFANVFKYSNIGKAILNTKGEIVDVNDAICNMLGYSNEELIGNPFKQFCAKEQNLNSFLDSIQKMLRREIKKFDLEMQYTRKDGNICWATLTTSLVRDDDGHAQFFIAQFQEITELKQLNNNLESQNRELYKTHLSLEKKVSQLKEFAGIITHDVRGPAHNIRKMLEMYETTDDPELKQASFVYLKKVSADLTNNLNELVQILQIHLEKDIPASECSFGEILDSVCLQLQDTILEKKARFVADFAVESLVYPRVFLQSIIYNLISNSLKYTLKNTPPVIEINTYSEADATFFTIKDNGLGLDLIKFGHMLFKFQKSFHSGFESKGIGLYLIKNQIEDQGGSISAESEPNKGMIFTIRF